MISHKQKNVTVEMDKTEKIKKIVFSTDEMKFQIHWADGSITHYGYNYHSTQGDLK